MIHIVINKISYPNCSSYLKDLILCIVEIFALY
jgi:hypothetical protein